MHVYIITDSTNGMIYVGQHCKDNLEAYLQWNIRAAEGNRGSKTRLYRAIRKHKGENFSIRSIVRLPDGFTKDEAREQLDRLEIFFIRVLESNNPDTGYNLTLGGGGQLGRRFTHTKEHKERMRQMMLGRTIAWSEKISATQKGRKKSQARKNALKGSHGGPHAKERSPDHRAKITEHKKKWWATVSPERKAEIVARIKEGRRKAQELKKNGSVGTAGQLA